jgi:DNA polymerase III delta subunit
MASAELASVYLISGSDRPKIELAVRRLRGRFDPAAVEILSAAEAGGADAVAACNALGLFAGEGRLVLVSEVERWKAGDAEAVAHYLRAPTPGTVLALVGEGVRETSALAKASARAGKFLSYDVRRRDLVRWLGDQLARHGARADPGALRALIALAGDDPSVLASEADKLASWADGEEIQIAVVEELAAAVEPPVWTLTDAWGRRDPGGVLRAAQERVERSGAPRSQVVPRIVSGIIDHVRLVRSCQALRERGVRSQEAAKLLRRKEFPVRKAYAHAEAFSLDEVRDALVRLAELDRAVKGGSRLPDELELTRALVEITRQRERAERQAVER